MRERDGRLHDVAPGAVVVGHAAQFVEGTPHRRVVPLGSPALDLGDLLGLHAFVDFEDRPELGIAEKR